MKILQTFGKVERLDQGLLLTDPHESAVNILPQVLPVGKNFVLSCRWSVTRKHGGASAYSSLRLLKVNIRDHFKFTSLGPHPNVCFFKKVIFIVVKYT